MTSEKRSVDNSIDGGDSKKRKGSSITDFFKSRSVEKKVTKPDGKTKEEATEQVTEETTVTENLDVSTCEFKKKFAESLTEEQKQLLQLEIDTLEDSWFEQLHKEFTKPYFIQLKKFLRTQWQNKVQIFPPQEDIYSWSRLTPLHNVKIIILGQDPYHNVNQAHGLAFSVKAPTPPPPSLKNMYKTLKIDYPDFQIPKDKGDLTQWAEQGVLMLNACLTVKAHEANSHAKKGWEQFTEAVLKVALQNTKDKKVLLLWGTPAQKRYDGLKMKASPEDLLVLKAVHPSPLSARRGFFECAHFKKSNQWLKSKDLKPIDWNLM